ncbi:hypothetical protein BJX62DRAFT_235341 [Aspergillus germanicus]
MEGSPDRGFLGNLAVAPFPQYAYVGRAQFQRNFLSGFGATDEIEYALISNIDRRTFEIEFRDVENRDNPCSRWTAFDADLHLLLVRMITSAAHDAAAALFNEQFESAVNRVGMKGALHPRRAGAHYAAIGAKQPDDAYLPVQLPPGRTPRWPSMVVEVAFSETATKLASDVRYWERASAGDVKLITTIRVFRNRPEIVLENWGINHHGKRERAQSITIKLVAGKAKVSGGPMVLDFEKLFLRAPMTPRERRNVVIRDKDLKLLAQHVWMEQGFVPWGQI